MTPPPSLEALLTELTAAVHAGDAHLAHTLAQALRQHIVNNAATPADLERQIRTLLAEITTPVVSIDPIEAVLTGERGIHWRTEPGVVYPVWFGTNRKPTATGTSFNNERHHSTTLGRVDVHVPAAHKFGTRGT